ncbi:TKL family protein kinase [Tritrichomonas foetus]|uniref:TKL family protein kinase n=1 Tax=Tritrichomonas foetus TaxID=1144522 RepID=A0A1J4L3P6_9EUKA|nr:TKL family protein kinase [Tritrichomonas foetus]|eukprot:OHT16574.1 TKL family protein kinase [Tritrichomonas foetus]
MNFMFEKLKYYIGAGLSSNYIQEKVDFTVGCWKVVDAVHKTTKQRVSLWLIDHEFLDKRFPNKADQTSYINGYMTCIKNSRKLVHPHLLKIHDIQLDPYYFEFTSEHVTSCLKNHVGKLDSNDASYIAFQIIDALSFLHNTSKKVHYGVSTSSIFLDDNYNAKLFNFNWLSDIDSDNTSKPPFSSYDITPTYPNIKYSAPEVVLSKSCQVQTDIFSFAAVFCELLTGKQLLECTTKETYKPEENPINKIQGMTTTFYQLLSNCLQPSASLRPVSTDLLREPAFNTVPIKILRYLDMIVLKDPKDKFEFFKALPKAIGGFSQNLLRCKIIPILVEECHINVRFAPILLPTIFQAGKYFPIDEFTEHVFNKVSFLIPVLEPPQVLIAFLQSIDMILESTDPSIHDEKVYPIFYSALKSDKDILQKEVLKKLPAVIPKIALNGIQKEILPLLLKLCTKTNDIKIISSAFECVKICLNKVDHNQFMKYLLPKIYDIWMSKQEPLLVPPLSDLLMSLKGNEVSTMAFAIPLCTELVSNSVCHPYYQKQLCSYMLASVTKYKTVNKLDEVEDPVPKQAEAPSAAMMELFDPLAAELNISPAQQTFDFTFSSGQLTSPSSPSQQQQFQFNSPLNSPQQSQSGGASSQFSFNPSFGSSPQASGLNTNNNNGGFSPDFGGLSFGSPSKPQQSSNQGFNPNFDSPTAQQTFTPDFSTPTFNPQFPSSNNFGSPVSNSNIRDLF